MHTHAIIKIHTLDTQETRETNCPLSRTSTKPKPSGGQREFGKPQVKCSDCENGAK